MYGLNSIWNTRNLTLNAPGSWYTFFKQQLYNHYKAQTRHLRQNSDLGLISNVSNISSNIQVHKQEHVLDDQFISSRCSCIMHLRGVHVSYTCKTLQYFLPRPCWRKSRFPLLQNHIRLVSGGGATRLVSWTCSYIDLYYDFWLGIRPAFTWNLNATHDSNFMFCFNGNVTWYQEITWNAMKNFHIQVASTAALTYFSIYGVKKKDEENCIDSHPGKGWLFKFVIVNPWFRGKFGIDFLRWDRIPG